MTTAIPTPKQVRTTVARNVKRFRATKRMSQDELARKAGVDRKTINRIERGHFSPSLDTLARIARAQKRKPIFYFLQGGK